MHETYSINCIIMPPALDLPASTSDPDADYLALVGQRVRQHRARRGMSRRILASASGVSERYLAQLESGKGNASLLVLRAVAVAMHVAIDDLLDPAQQPIEYWLLRERLRSAAHGELKRVLGSLGHGWNSIDQTRPHIALIGLRGAGKSTLGAALARLLHLPRIELVQEIERAAGIPVAQIFSGGGQTAYRRYERQALVDSMQRFDHAIITVGGSLVSEPETYERLLASCYTIWLKASPEEHMERVMQQGDLRPMADQRHAMDDLKRILNEREALYSRADISIDTSALSVEATLDQLLALPVVRAFLRNQEVTR